MSTDQLRALYASQPVHRRSTPGLEVYQHQYQAFDAFAREDREKIDKLVPRGKPVPPAVRRQLGAVDKHKPAKSFKLRRRLTEEDESFGQPDFVPVKVFVPRDITVGDVDIVDMDDVGSVAEQLMATHLNLRSYGTNLRVAMQEKLAASGLHMDVPSLSAEAVDADVRLGACRHLIPTNLFLEDVFPNDGLSKSRAAFIKAFPHLQKGTEAATQPDREDDDSADEKDGEEQGMRMMKAFAGRETEQATAIAESVAALTSGQLSDPDIGADDVRAVASGKFKSFYDLLDNSEVVEFTDEHVRQVQQYLFPNVMIDPAQLDFNCLRLSDNLNLKAHQFIDAMYLRRQEDSGIGGCVLANATGTGKTAIYLYAIYTATQDIERRVAAGVVFDFARLICSS